MELIDFLPYAFSLLTAGIASFVTYFLCEKNFQKKLKKSQTRNDEKISEMKEDNVASKKQLLRLHHDCEQIKKQMASEESKEFKAQDQPVLSPIVKEMFNSVVTYITITQDKTN